MVAKKLTSKTFDVKQSFDVKKSFDVKHFFDVKKLFDVKKCLTSQQRKERSRLSKLCSIEVHPNKLKIIRVKNLWMY